MGKPKLYKKLINSTNYLLAKIGTYFASIQKEYLYQIPV